MKLLRETIDSLRGWVKYWRTIAVKALAQVEILQDRLRRSDAGYKRTVEKLEACLAEEPGPLATMQLSVFSRVCILIRAQRSIIQRQRDMLTKQRGDSSKLLLWAKLKHFSEKEQAMIEALSDAMAGLPEFSGDGPIWDRAASCIKRLQHDNVRLRGPRIICSDCGAEREVQSRIPGMTQFKPCAKCGCIAIKR